MYCGPSVEKSRRAGIIYYWIQFLLGRPPVYHRFADQMAPLTPEEPPNLPPGPHSILARNYYYGRDARGEVKPPVEIKPPEIRHPQFKRCEIHCVPRARVPGNLFHWDSYKTHLASLETDVCSKKDESLSMTEESSDEN